MAEHQRRTHGSVLAQIDTTGVAHGGTAASEVCYGEQALVPCTTPTTLIERKNGQQLKQQLLRPMHGLDAGANPGDSLESDVFSSVSSTLTSNGRSIHGSGQFGDADDVFREFGRVPLFSELPPRLRGPSTFEQLPDELVLTHIFSRLDSTVLARCSCVCTQVRRWSDNNRLWKQLCQQRWGSEFVKRRSEGIANRAWKLHFVERTRQHRITVAESGLSLARMTLQDEATAKKSQRPGRSQLEAACVYMPKSHEHVATMEMARSTQVMNTSIWTMEQPSPPQPASGGKKTRRRGRRGRNAKAASTPPKPEGGADASPAMRHRTATAVSSTGGGGARRLAPSPPVASNAAASTNQPHLAPSPPPGVATRRSPTFGQRRPSADAGVGRKQPTPPPPRSRHHHSLRPSDATPPPAPRGGGGMPPSRSFSPSSNYAACVTPTRMFNVDDDVSSDDEGDDDIGDAIYSDLCHPIYGGAQSGHQPVNGSVADSVAGKDEHGSSHGGAGCPECTVASPPCPWHGEALSQYCIQCKTLVCNRCCLFGHHSGHPRMSADEAYRQVKVDLAGAKERLGQLSAEADSYDARMATERERVAKARSAMKKSLRTSIKGLRDLLNRKQNDLMEMIRREEEAKLTQVVAMSEQLAGLRKQLGESERAAAAAEAVKKDCPLLIESSNALAERTQAAAAVLGGIDNELALLPQLAAFSFSLNDQLVRERIETLAFCSE
jgi:hypothetical protein